MENAKQGIGDVQCFRQCRFNDLSIECKRLAHFCPGLALLFFNQTAKFIHLALLRNVLLQHSNFKIAAKESQMIIEHLSKNT